MDLETFRDTIIQKLALIVDSNSEISQKIEQGIYNYTLKLY